MKLKDLNIEELPPNTIRVYSSNTEYTDFNSYIEYYKKQGDRMVPNRTDGPSILINIELNDSPADLYIRYMINGNYINGRARLWFKNGELLDRNPYIQYFYNNNQCLSIKNDKEYSNFLKTQVFK